MPLQPNRKTMERVEKKVQWFAMSCNVGEKWSKYIVSL